jgi:flagellar hook-associated protein 3 FlgL
MRISTKQVFTSGLDSLQKHTNDVLEAQRQISSGNRYRVASQNALAAGLGVQVDFDRNQFEMFKVNQDYARASLGSADTQIESIGLAVERFRTLMVQAGADTIGVQGRKLIVQEMQTIQRTIKNFAEAVDANGEPILRQVDASGLTAVYVAPSVDLFTSVRYEEIMGRVRPDSSSTGAFIDVDQELSAIIATIDSNAPPTALQIERMTSVSEQITDAQVKVGAIENQLEAAEESAELQKSNIDGARSRILEPDLAEATTDLTRANALLQAAQAIMSKLDINSLFQKL